MKAVKAHLAKNDPDEVEKFEKGAAAYAKKILGNFKEYEFVGLVIYRIRPGTNLRDE